MPYRWEPTTGDNGRYRDTTTGRYVPASVVRGELDKYLQSSNEPIRVLSEQLRTGQLNIQDWQTVMMREIKSAHLNAVAESVGGYQNMTQEHYGRAGAYIREQYKYLRDFADDIASGKQRLDGTLTRRMELYISSARESYYNSIQANLPHEITHIGSILNPADHCRDCIYFDGKWFTMSDSSYMKIGSRACNKNCKCSERYGVEVGGEIIEVMRA